jgi:hypothetical protein
MTPTSFEFTLILPGDQRLIGAVRLLAAQAAGYAQLTADASEILAAHVARATETAVTAGGDARATIRVRFSGDQATVHVVISCATRSSTPLPTSTSSDGLRVEWTADGNQRTCNIRHRVPS